MPASVKHLSNLKGLGKAVDGVFARWLGDGKYYKVVVVEDHKTEAGKTECRCRFEDGTSYWIDTKQMHLQFDIETLPEELTLCCVCSSEHSKTPNELIICDCCNQGYHIQCHETKIDRETLQLDNEEAEWICATCKGLLSQDSQPADSPKKSKRRSSLPNKTPRRSSGSKTARSASKPAKKKTPKLKKEAKIKFNKRDKNVAVVTSTTGPTIPGPATPPGEPNHAAESVSEPVELRTVLGVDQKIEHVDPLLQEKAQEVIALSKKHNGEIHDTAKFVETVCPGATDISEPFMKEAPVRKRRGPKAAAF